MSVSRSLPTQRVALSDQARPLPARPTAAYDFDVVTDVLPGPGIADAEPVEPAVEQTPGQHPSRTA